MKINKQTYFDVVRLIFENAADGICIIDDDGIIQWYNNTFKQMFKFEKNDITGLNVGIIMPEVIAKEHTKYIKRYLKSGKSKIIGTGREIIAKNNHGQFFSIYLSVSESFVDGHVYFIGIMHRTTISHEDIETKVNQITQLINDWHLGQSTITIENH